jgi:TonB-dependent SusC/RagA subfamily outer membrane receptor
MRLVIQIVHRTPNAWRISALGGILIASMLTACATAKPRETAAPAAPSGQAAVVDAQQTPNEPIEKYLAARSAGVVIGRAADGSPTVRIRGGSSSMYGNNAPLYIVDGVPFSPTSEGGLSGINPYDIESIRVLKEAADLTMYGVRGANGVIVIKTKSARR